MAKPMRQSALWGHFTEGRFGAQQPREMGIELAERRPPGIAQINGAPEAAALTAALGDFGLETTPVSNRSCRGTRATLLWNGPGMWLVESPDVDSPGLLHELRSALAQTDATVTDLSHARTIVRVRGARAPELLCKGCPADIQALATGDCLVTQLAHFSVMMHSIDGAQGVDLYVFRSFGLALWEWLSGAAEEFGYRVVGQ